MFLFSAGILCFLAFVAHAFFGDKEYRNIPVQLDTPKAKDSWVQTRSGWHWVSVDLLLSSLLLMLISTTDMVQAKSEILNLMCLYFVCCGAAWLVTVFVSKHNNRQLISVGQWLFCFVMSFLIYLGNTY